MTERKFIPVDEETAERIASIIGENSAARAALNDLHRRREAGEQVALYRAGNAWFTGPDYRAALTSNMASE